MNFTMILEHAVCNSEPTKVHVWFENLSSQLAEQFLHVRSHCQQTLIRLASGLKEKTLFSFSLFTSQPPLDEQTSRCRHEEFA